MSPLPLLIKEKKYGYVFYDCKLTAEPEATKVYLSVPGVRMRKLYLSVANWGNTFFRWLEQLGQEGKRENCLLCRI